MLPSPASPRRTGHPAVSHGWGPGSHRSPSGVARVGTGAAPVPRRCRTAGIAAPHRSPCGVAQVGGWHRTGRVEEPHRRQRRAAPVTLRCRTGGRRRRTGHPAVSHGWGTASHRSPCGVARVGAGIAPVTLRGRTGGARRRTGHSAVSHGWAPASHRSPSGVAPAGTATPHHSCGGGAQVGAPSPPRRWLFRSCALPDIFAGAYVAHHKGAEACPISLPTLPSSPRCPARFRRRSSFLPMRRPFSATASRRATPSRWAPASSR